MKHLVILRLLVMLRRIWKSLDKLGEIEQARLDLDKDKLAMDHPRWHQAGGRVPASPKLAEISRANVEDLNRNWRAKHPEFED